MKFRSRPVVALLSDFGTDDWFVGAMKGEVLRLCPGATLVDITHAVPPGDIAAGARALEAARSSFPARTVFHAVVDPGVGSDRRAVIVRDGGQWFVGPDNGLFAFLGVAPCRVLPAISPVPGPPCSTFHGRDIFAPAAGRLARGDDPARLAPALATLSVFEPDHPGPCIINDIAFGRIVGFDRFGNAITDIPWAFGAHTTQAAAAGPPHPRWPIVRCYADVPPGAPLAYWGATGHLEIAVRGGDARRSLSLHVTQAITLSGTANP